ncbi:hypothetical protein [Leclercia adecarboxylata]|uniref:hypothetical protein n=1 Tax=Leclercia adecarboxylata TaxID=83655 RepID=UPI00301B1BA4
MSANTRKYRANLDSQSGSFIRGWCCATDATAASVTVLINDVAVATFPAYQERQDLKKHNICSQGGGFEADISSFIKYGENVVKVVDPDGMTIPNGQFTITSRKWIQGESEHLFDSSPKKIGVYGNKDIATNMKNGFVLPQLIHCLNLSVSDGSEGDEDCNIWFDIPAGDIPKSVVNLINKDLNDIQKSSIDIHHKAVFGRGVCVTKSEIVPDKLYVLKSDENAAHDGKVIKGEEALTREFNGSVIQNLIDNRLNENEVLDIRVPVIGGSIPFAYLKVRPISIRFSNQNSRCSIAMVDTVFSKEEVSQITEFAKLNNIDYAELDILRDANSKDIWIVDVNNTPAGPPNGLHKIEKNLAIREMSLLFYEKFIA